MEIQLRDYQQLGKQQIRQSFADHIKHVLLVLATGGGKTIIGCSIILDALTRNKRILVIVHRDKLVQRWADDFKTFGIPYGIIQGEKPETDAPVKIASIDTYINRLGDYGDFDIIITDEAHRSCADLYSQAVEYHKARGSYLIGLTATPHRLDGLGLNNLYDKMIECVDMLSLMDLGYLTKMVIYSANPPDLSMVMSSDAAYLRKVGGPKRITGIVDVCKKHVDQMGVVFAVNIKDAKEITKELNDSGLNAVCIHSKQNDAEQAKIIADWRARKHLILVSVDVVTEGFDEKQIQFGVDAAQTSSLTKFTQRWGRLVRAWYADGYDLQTQKGRLSAIANGEKPVVYMYDLSGNYWLFGNPWDNHHWSLEGRKPSKKSMTEAILSVRICDGCGRTYNSASDHCPYCGETIKHTKRIIKQSDGKLILVTQDEYDKIELEKQKKEDRKAEYTARKKAAKTFEEYEAVERDLGLKKGWAYVNYNIYRKYINKY